MIDEVVRRERGRIVGGLLRICGGLDAAEEAFQEATLSALGAWQQEVPGNPGAWLMTAAKNSAKDARRHRAIVESTAPLLAEDEMDERETLDTVSDDQPLTYQWFTANKGTEFKVGVFELDADGNPVAGEHVGMKLQDRKSVV